MGRKPRQCGTPKSNSKFSLTPKQRTVIVISTARRVQDVTSQMRIGQAIKQLSHHNNAPFDSQGKPKITLMLLDQQNAQEQGSIDTKDIVTTRHIIKDTPPTLITGMSISQLYIPFRSGRNGRNISYRYANRYETTPYSTSGKISACFGPFRPVYVIWPEYFLGFYILFLGHDKPQFKNKKL